MGDGLMGGGFGGLYRSSWISRRNLNLGLVWPGLVLPARKFPRRPTFLAIASRCGRRDSCTFTKDGCPPDIRGSIQNEIQKYKTEPDNFEASRSKQDPFHSHTRRVVAHRDRPTAAFHVSRRPAALGRPQTAPRSPLPAPRPPAPPARHKDMEVSGL